MRLVPVTQGNHFLRCTCDFPRLLHNVGLPILVNIKWRNNSARFLPFLWVLLREMSIAEHQIFCFAVLYDAPDEPGSDKLTVYRFWPLGIFSQRCAFRNSIFVSADVMHLFDAMCFSCTVNTFSIFDSVSEYCRGAITHYKDFVWNWNSER